jgi:hypothetical protein
MALRGLHGKKTFVQITCNMNGQIARGEVRAEAELHAARFEIDIRAAQSK